MHMASVQNNNLIRTLPIFIFKIAQKKFLTNLSPNWPFKVKPPSKISVFNMPVRPSMPAFHQRLFHQNSWIRIRQSFQWYLQITKPQEPPSLSIYKITIPTLILLLYGRSSDCKISISLQWIFQLFKEVVDNSNSRLNRSIIGTLYSGLSLI